jgi:hypothetical protein
VDGGSQDALASILFAEPRRANKSPVVLAAGQSVISGCLVLSTFNSFRAPPVRMRGAEIVEVLLEHRSYLVWAAVWSPTAICQPASPFLRVPRDPLVSDATADAVSLSECHY